MLMSNENEGMPLGLKSASALIKTHGKSPFFIWSKGSEISISSLNLQSPDLVIKTMGKTGLWFLLSSEIEFSGCKIHPIPSGLFLIFLSKCSWLKYINKTDQHQKPYFTHKLGLIHGF